MFERNSFRVQLGYSDLLCLSAAEESLSVVCRLCTSRTASQIELSSHTSRSARDVIGDSTFRREVQQQSKVCIQTRPRSFPQLKVCFSTAVTLHISQWNASQSVSPHNSDVDNKPIRPWSQILWFDSRQHMSRL